MSSARSRSIHPDAVDIIIDQWKRELPELASEHMALIGRLKRCSILLAPRLDEVLLPMISVMAPLTCWRRYAARVRPIF